MKAGFRGRGGESGLSEVVGFVLIIALLMAVFSLYLTYGVPAQGRENEILHMNTVKDQFIDYKIGLDALANNNKVGTTVSNSFTLGSEGSFTEGVMGIIPIMKPVSSGGIFSINRRTTQPETLTITSLSLIRDPINTSARTSFDLPVVPDFTPDHVYVNITVPSSTILSATSTFGLSVSATAMNATRWTAFVNLTPQLSSSQYYVKNSSGINPSHPCDGIENANQYGTPIEIIGPPAYCLIPMNTYELIDRDISLSIRKGAIPSMEKYVIYKNITPGHTYTIDLMDSAYGLNTATAAGDQITIVEDLPLSPLNGTGNVTYDFREQTYSIDPISLGAIDYRSQNNYWISQEYYYQMGGVFLSQIDGNNTYKLPPGITFSMDINPSRPITVVTIDAVSITNPYGGSVVGGSSPVQVKTTLVSSYTFPYADGIANTKWIRIGVNTSDDQARAMWKNYFDYTAKVAGLPDETETGIAGTESYIVIHGTDAADTGDYDIKVVATNATYTALLYGVGG